MHLLCRNYSLIFLSIKIFSWDLCYFITLTSLFDARTDWVYVYDPSKIEYDISKQKNAWTQGPLHLQSWLFHVCLKVEQCMMEPMILYYLPLLPWTNTMCSLHCLLVSLRIPILLIEYNLWEETHINVIVHTTPKWIKDNK